MHMEPRPTAAQILAPAATDMTTGCAAEWRISKEQLAAAERASRYHAGQAAPASNGDSAAHAA